MAKFPFDPAGAKIYFRPVDKSSARAATLSLLAFALSSLMAIAAAERPVNCEFTGTLPVYFPAPDSLGGWRTATS